MSWLKIISAIAVSIFVLTITMINYAVAGEKRKLKYHGASFRDSWQQFEVGDEEGHIIAISKTKQIYFDEITGEKIFSSGVSFIENNLKTGQGFMQGYGVSTDKDGDKMCRSFEGKPVGKGHWKGTFVRTKGTGKHEGVKGSGTWESHSSGKGQSYVEPEGEIELPYY